MKYPLVSCIMPTANREKYIPSAIQQFLQQDYPAKELIIVDDGEHPIKKLVPNNPFISYYYTKEPVGSIGIKRNFACSKCRGEVIVHWDDDDWHANDWLSAEAYFLKVTDAHLTGMQHIMYYDAIIDKIYMVTRTHSDGSDPLDWVHGSTLAYKKSFWQKNPFKDLAIGEDDDFIQNNAGTLYIHDYRQGYVCILHPHNTVVRSFENKKFKVVKSI
jgi:glycosyltransferase involved in cell wall biosynthesis